ncbi:hypothetical protein ES319_D09G240700v1 [Gossypium barbadense]|uniref:Pectinesterase inhibitor domain-containing protein n=1 Tax=Gossypium barbadense TaxID=3634 RepID=A0A5J5Q6R9_GOSBA|nr:hypothetical protein ES319_D09G240700v1 [Gossypium barbadense]PPD82616.1 hypothetical protein GOBAR_DD20448 [Gossypium barbadense]
MKHLISILVFFLFFTTSSIALTPSSYNVRQGDQTLPAVIDPKLQQICDKTDNPVECLITTIPFLRKKVAINPVSILNIEVEAIDIKTKEALDKASKLLLSSSNSKPITNCFNICINNYKSILESKHRILDAISIGDDKQLRVELSSNVDKIYHCEDAFEEANVKSPITEVNSLLGKMITNSLTITIDMVHFHNKN